MRKRKRIGNSLPVEFFALRFHRAILRDPERLAAPRIAHWFLRARGLASVSQLE